MRTALAGGFIHTRRAPKRWNFFSSRLIEVHIGPRLILPDVHQVNKSLYLYTFAH